MIINRKVEVTNYNEVWPVMFKEEVEILKKILGDIAIAYHHIGSTAIVGINAKPIIDILVEVNDIKSVDQFNETFVEEGFMVMGEYGIPQRQFYIKGDLVNRSRHIHIFNQGDKEVKRHINFRDYLNAHPEVAEEYSNLKVQLAKNHPNNMEAYINGKDSLIKAIDSKAEAWVKQINIDS